MPRPVALAALAAALGLAACSPRSPSAHGCPSGQERCGFVCVDPATYATDRANCGACAVACASGASCTSGACACPAGQVVCDGACVDPATWASDDANCGGCGVACGAGTCTGGVCDCGAFTSCPTGTPRCVDGLTDPDHCGIGAAACDRACPLAGAACDAGTCACPPGTTACPVATPTACVNLQTDEASCGACGTPCATGATCTSGACGCPAGESVCGGACVNRQLDPANCGICGAVCAAGATCGAGACACPSAQPTVCGITSASAGTCCAGSGCCTPAGAGPSTCMTEHSNGLGQHFHDCSPLYEPASTTTSAAALAAADAWSPGTTYAGTVCDPFCIARQTTSACAVWCFGQSPLAGRAKATPSLACAGACPYSEYAVWR